MGVSNEKDQITAQLDLFPEISGLQGEWLPYPYHCCGLSDLDRRVLRSYAGFLRSSSQTSHLPIKLPYALEDVL